MKKPFTPEEVAAKYKEHAVKPATSIFGIFTVAGEPIRLYDEEDRRCCALSVLLIGDEVSIDCQDPGVIGLAEKKYPGLHAWSFIDGFDGNSIEAAKVIQQDFDEESYKLGLEVHEYLKKEYPGTW